LYVDWKNDGITREEYHRMKQVLSKKEQELLRNYYRALTICMKNRKI